MAANLDLIGQLYEEWPRAAQAGDHVLSVPAAVSNSRRVQAQEISALTTLT